MWKLIKALFREIKYGIILKLAGTDPVIINSTIYDDVADYNFDNCSGLCYNNKIKKHVYTKIQLRGGSTRVSNSVVYKPSY